MNLLGARTSGTTELFDYDSAEADANDEIVPARKEK